MERETQRDRRSVSRPKTFMYVRIILPRAVRALACEGSAGLPRFLLSNESRDSRGVAPRRTATEPKGKQHQGPAHARMCGGSIRLLTSMI